MKKIATIIPLVFLFVFSFSSCKKEAGEGGNSSIYGSITVRNYNSTFTDLLSEYPGADEDVYIIYGNDKSYSDKIKTNYLGIYEFKYLRPGNYKIYIYSKDSTLQSPSGIVPVVKEVEITDNDQEIKAPDITIFK